MCVFLNANKKGVLGVVFGPVPMPFPPRQGTCKGEQLFGFGISHEKARDMRGRFRLAWVAPPMMAASCLTRRRYDLATNQSHRHLFQTIR